MQFLCFLRCESFQLFNTGVLLEYAGHSPPVQDHRVILNFTGCVRSKRIFSARLQVGKYVLISDSLNTQYSANIRIYTIVRQRSIPRKEGETERANKREGEKKKEKRRE
mgnify:CR=1 FL=1